MLEFIRHHLKFYRMDNLENKTLNHVNYKSTIHFGQMEWFTSKFIILMEIWTQIHYPVHTSMWNPFSSLTIFYFIHLKSNVLLSFCNRFYTTQISLFYRPIGFNFVCSIPLLQFSITLIERTKNNVNIIMLFSYFSCNLIFFVNRS